MADYGIFIWPCFIATILSLVGLGFFSWRSKKNAENYIDELECYLKNLSKK